MIKIKNIPNVITLIRVILSIVLLFIEPLSLLFYIIYILCGFSDVLDGFIARKFKITSLFGSKLDSVADITFFTVLIIIFIPIIELNSWLLVWIGIIVFLRIVLLAFVYKKYHTCAFLHTYANKLTGVTLFLFPLIYPMLSVVIILILATYSVIEEFIINIKSKKLMRDVKSIFVMKKLS